MPQLDLKGRISDVNLNTMSRTSARAYLSNPDNLPDITDYEDEVLSTDIGRLSSYYDINTLDKPDEFIERFNSEFDSPSGRTFKQKVADGLGVYTYLVKRDERAKESITKFRLEKVGIRRTTKAVQREIRRIFEFNFRTVEGRLPAKDRREFKEQGFSIQEIREKNRVKETKLFREVSRQNADAIATGKVRQIRYTDTYGNKQVRYFNGKAFMKTDLGKSVLKNLGFMIKARRDE